MEYWNAGLLEYWGRELMTFKSISKNLNWVFGKLVEKAAFHGLAVYNPSFQTSIIPSFHRPMGWL